jgi:outer membrane receptor protein involved in Fe transport
MLVLSGVFHLRANAHNPMHALLLAVCCTVTFHVHASSGAPLGGAHVVLHGSRAYAASTDSSGNTSVDADPGVYRVDTTARGYTGVSIDLDLKNASTVDVALQPLDAPTLRTIGTVTVDGRLAPIVGEIPSVAVSRPDMDRLGDNRVVEALEALPGATFTRPDGGAASAIDVVSLRGPDPSESLIALDGQLLNDGNTGDLDLSRFPVAAFSGVDVTEGLGPEDSNGSNTFGGAINFISLQPTQTPHVGFSTSGGSFGQSESWLNATGARDKLGYAFAVDDQNEGGYVNQTVPLYSSVAGSTCEPCPTHLGSSVASHLGLGNLTWTFSQNADITARVFLLGDIRDESSAINGIDYNASDIGTPEYGNFIGPGDLTFAQNIRAYQLRGRAPLGSGELTAELSESDNGVTTSGSPSSPYDVTHIDHRYNGALTWGRTFATSQFTIGGYTRYESLQFFAPASTNGSALTQSEIEPLLGQAINVFYARGGFEPTAKLRLDGGVFESRYTSFGSNLDGRFGAIYALHPKTSLRFSLGTGFRAPLLLERYQFPLTQLQQDANGVFIGQGSPGEHPEHATEYELGISHEFASSTLDFSLYQTNLRDPIEIYYPLALADSGACKHQTPEAPVPGCISYNSNVGNAVYQGAEVRYVQRFVPQHLFLTAMYGLNVAYPKNLNANYSNPTSAGSLVDNTQFLGIPQQQGSLELDWANGSWHAATEAVFRGNNNELNQGPFTWIDASAGMRLNTWSDLTVAATNIFNDAAGRFTEFGAGVPYIGADETVLPTNRFFVEPVGVRVIFTARQ